MEAAPDVEGNDFVLFSLYQSLPVGAAFVDSERRVFAANRKMRACFPLLSGGQQGLPVCEAVRCRRFWDGADPAGRRCKDCVLSRALEWTLCDRKPMGETKWKHVCPGPAGRSCASRTGSACRWFSVSGVPVSFCGKPYAALFFGDITALVLQGEILRKKLRLDPQTGVLNKTSLLRSLDALLRTERRGPVTVCMVDFDNFKAVNDRYGHLTGDKVLATFCRIARGSIRAGDRLGRFGGEEFLFVFRSDRRQAASILKRIQFDLRKAFFGVLALPVTFSAGVACREGTSSGWKDLVQEADRLLYRAKAEGKNRIVLAGPESPGRKVSRDRNG